ncbi:uncharacterized protein BDR25DRAFT_339691 [Lindgomyces ingoldianus]|uniref:Uncharacterized protein n=1 Tax=Lindgomyces ingoldianus TaxID=673940 RepID=A0ACB6R974_9PLEO|nr:uncharacterized protein BDR25DRAFT_339691 [Lindgomyces ingoldianus]KAF2475637.1 hypothetical protein BDR25DRAFT_339691 [Lindgomyces ingoldianus]
MTSNDSTPTIYFGYGSNLWLHQMELRCPTSKFLGVARLDEYKWIINDRGYANVVEVKSATSAKEAKEEDTNPVNKKSKYDNVVFGLVYSLEPKDEDRLDVNEGVPFAYTKEYLACDFWKSSDGKWTDVSKPSTCEKEMLVYVDRKRTEESTPKKEYIWRMNRGIEDADMMGVPRGYVEGVMRKFIPVEEEEGGRGEGNGKRRSVEDKAWEQARRFVDEN